MIVNWCGSFWIDPWLASLKLAWTSLFTTRAPRFIYEWLVNMLAKRCHDSSMNGVSSPWPPASSRINHLEPSPIVTHRLSIKHQSSVSWTVHHLQESFTRQIMNHHQFITIYELSFHESTINHQWTTIVSHPPSNHHDLPWLSPNAIHQAQKLYLRPGAPNDGSPLMVAGGETGGAQWFMSWFIDGCWKCWA